MKEFEVGDFRIFGNEKIILRTDLEIVTVNTGAEYNGKKIINLLKKMEILVSEEWKPYPSVFWISVGEQLQTICFAKEDSNSEEVTVFASPNGVPDGELMLNAKKKGIYTETIG